MGRWMAIGLACFVVITVLCCGAIYKWFSSKQEYKSYMDIGAGEVTTFHAESMAGDVCSKHDL